MSKNTGITPDYVCDITKEELQKYNLTLTPYFFAEKEAISQGTDYVYVGFTKEVKDHVN